MGKWKGISLLYFAFLLLPMRLNSPFFFCLLANDMNFVTCIFIFIAIWLFRCVFFFFWCWCVGTCFKSWLFLLCWIYIFASVFFSLLICLWQLWCYGISKHLYCTIYQSVLFLVPDGRKKEFGGLKCRILHLLWPVLALQLWTKPPTSLNFPSAGCVTELSIFPGLPRPAPCREGHGRSCLPGFMAILSFS